MTKAVEIVYVPDDIPTLKFTMRKMNRKKFSSLSKKEKKDVTAFFRDVRDIVNRFEESVMKHIKENG